MDLRTLLIGFLGWALYPMWLAAGALDYLCHRRTDIEHTSGPVESWLHVAQFACIGVLLSLALLVQPTLAVWIAMLFIAVTHSALAFIDVSYTIKRRPVTPLEQLAHNFLDVIPLFTVGLIGVLNWTAMQDATSTMTQSAGLSDAISPGARTLVLGSFVVLAGSPILEELIRSLRARRGGSRQTASHDVLHALSRR